MLGQGSSQPGPYAGIEGSGKTLLAEGKRLHRDDDDGGHAASVGNSRVEPPVWIDMARATWNGVTLAESDDTVVVEGNHYFPPQSINREFFSASEKTTVCGWKGTASYYDITANGETNASAAWYYSTPKDAVSEIKDHVAFWGGVTVEA